MRDVFAIIGSGLVGYGLFLIWPPLTYIWFGAIIMIVAILSAAVKGSGSGDDTR